MVRRQRNNQGVQGMKQVRWAAVAAFAMLVGATPQADADAAQTGKASYYKHGHRTANGERFNPDGYTAAHRTLPFGTRVLVTNLKNGKSVIVRVNDRGPFVKSRIIDVSYGAAKVLGMTGAGVATGQDRAAAEAAAAPAAAAAAPAAAGRSRGREHGRGLLPALGAWGTAAELRFPILRHAIIYFFDPWRRWHCPALDVVWR